ncbi:MAG: AAA family ATPase, partial [Butyricicoccaceae bacterium]
MYQEIANLILYGDLEQDSILYQLGEIFRRHEDGTATKAQTIRDIYTQVKRLLTVATQYGFDKNLWHNYLTFLLITDENPFSLTCEKVGANVGSVNYFAKNDFQAFRALFDYDFSKIERELGIDCFSRLSDYKAIGKKELMYNKNVSEKVQALSARLEQAQDDDAFFTAVTDFYKAYGVGMFGLNKAFRIEGDGAGSLRFLPINNMDRVMLDDLIGYEIQKKQLIDTTEAIVEG